MAALGDAVTNRAVGGSFTTDLAGQVADLDLTAYDVLVVSVGTNDAAPWKQVPLHEAERALAAFVVDLPLPLVLVAPPGVDEARLRRPEDRTNDLVDDYAACAAQVVEAAGGSVVDTRAVLAPLGAGAFLEDGVHLTPAAYDALLPVIADAVEACAGQPAGRG